MPLVVIVVAILGILAGFSIYSVGIKVEKLVGSVSDSVNSLDNSINDATKPFSTLASLFGAPDSNNNSGTNSNGGPNKVNLGEVAVLGVAGLIILRIVRVI